jgi:hypothetical protein
MNKLYENAGLSTDEAALMPSYIDGDVDFYDTPAFEKLYEYLAFETAEMPYGVAKARTGDPDLWILEYLAELV